MRAALPGQFFVAMAVGLAAGLPHLAAAAGPVDPSYGRVEGDVTVAPGIGLGAEPRGPGLVAEVRLRYLETAGLFVVYEDGSLIGSAAEPRRALSLGTELRPLFLARYLQDLELRRAWFDLVLDSLGLDLGAVYSQPAGESFQTQPGLRVGLGVGVPLLMRTNGPWLGIHGGVRWSEESLATGRVRGADDRAGYLALTIVYEQLFMTHLVDAGDRQLE